MQLSQQHDGSAGKGSEQTDRAVREMQLDMSMRLAPCTVATSLCVVQVIVFVFWSGRPPYYLTVLEATILALSGLCGYESWRWSSRGKRVDLARYTRVATETAFVFGLTLASIPVVLYVTATEPERTVIASTCAGLIATGMSLAVTPTLAFAFSAPIVAGSFIALALTGEIYNISLAILLTFYAAFLAFLVLKFSHLVVARVAAETALRRQQETTSLLLNDFEEGSSDWLWETDGRYRLQHTSTRFEQAASVVKGALHGRQIFSLLGAVSSKDNDVISLLKKRRAFRGVEVEYPLGSEKRVWSVSGKPIFTAGGDFIGYRGVGSDVTDKRRSEQQLSFLALNDSLTGLPNRTSILGKLEELQAGFQRGEDFSVFCLDVDGFKDVNDNFGHAVGDLLLQGVALRLKEFFARIPGAMAGRMSGDEFVVLMDGSDCANEAVLGAYASAVLNAMRKPLEVNDLRLTVGFSIGAAIASRHGAADILKRADRALYCVKSAGRGHFRIFEPAMDEGNDARSALLSELGAALANRDFYLEFQPLMSRNGEDVEGFEALVRWRSLSRGAVSPSIFVPLAEESGVIFALGQWIIEEACRAAVEWPESVSVAVNVSPVQLRHSDLAEMVRQALRASGLPASRLELEVTESVFMDQGPTTRGNLQRLSAMGVRLSLDDFGTGFSSLNYLRSVHFDKVKIDQVFVRGLPRAVDLAIVKSVVAIASAQGMKVTAEGVETAEQWGCLVAQGCHQLQGFLFSHPMSAPEAAQFAHRHGRGSTRQAKLA